MRPITGEPAEQHIEAAIAWQLTTTEAPLTPAQQAQFDTWLQQDPRHQLAWQRIHELHELAARPVAQTAIQEVAALQQQNVFVTAKHFLQEHASAQKGVLLSMLFVSLSYAYVQQHQWPAWAMADHRSTRHQVKTISLPDGSQLTLAGASAVDVRYTPSQRTIVLRKGEVIATVAKDPNRPFVVNSSQGSATALGTEFSVKAWSEHLVDVTVLSSKVKVCASGSSPEDSNDCQNLQGNQKITLTPKGLSPLINTDAQAQAAWRDHRLVANNMTLAEVLSRVSKQQPGITHFDQRALSAYRISGVFPLDNPDEAYAALQALYPLQIKRYTPYLTLITLAP
ncbi:MAG: FecR domain-containing protein [Neisseriaceae bacterium]|nr:FecR domain-containing protein [Neisseriaceae bacterium]